MCYDNFNTSCTQKGHQIFDSKAGLPFIKIDYSRAFQLPSMSIMIFTIMNAGDVSFSLSGATYQNNSCVALEDIGEGSGALLCMTNFTACCRRERTGTESGLGSWYFPNGTEVPSSGEQLDFYRTRGQRVIRLNRRRGGEEGIYHCEIPDSMNVTQSIYIGVYTAGSGE